MIVKMSMVFGYCEYLSMGFLLGWLVFYVVINDGLFEDECGKKFVVEIWDSEIGG